MGIMAKVSFSDTFAFLLYFFFWIACSAEVEWVDVVRLKIWNFNNYLCWKFYVYLTILESYIGI